MFHTAQRVLAGLCVAVSMIFIAMPTVKAQSPDGGFEAKLVVVDLGEILRKAEATKKVRALLDEKRDEFQREFSQKEREMLSREKELKSQQSILSPESYRKQVAQFQADVAEIQKQIQARRQSLDNAFQSVQNQIKDIAIEIITEFSTENDFDMVLNRQSAVIFKNQLDISQIILQRLDERTKNARFEIDEKPSGE